MAQQHDHRSGAPSHALVARLRVRQLALLLAVEQHRTVSRVASELGLTQPAVTKAVQEVEDIFSATLFERTARGLKPNAAGKAILALARHWLAELDATAEALKSIQTGREGRLRLGVAHGIPDTFLWPALQHLLDGATRVSVMTREGTTDELVTALVGRELDCALGRSYDGDATGLVQQALYEQEACLVMASASARRMARAPLELKQLANLNWILPPANTPMRRTYNAMFIAAGLQPPAPLLEAVYGRSVGAVLRLVPDAIAIVAKDVLVDLVDAGGCEALPLQLGLNLPPICFFTTVDLDQHPVVGSLRQKMIDTAESLRRGGRNGR
ncbi:MAG: LysR family transcriptional regulator [Burkholderiaceae bacterium]|nr:LysR family transcriptional regulator [Burkholderiaceae bacterium]